MSGSDPAALHASRCRGSVHARNLATAAAAAANAGAAIAQHVIACPLFQAASSVGLYITCERLREVDTSALLAAALAAGKQLRPSWGRGHACHMRQKQQLGSSRVLACAVAVGCQCTHTLHALQCTRRQACLCAAG